MLDKPAVYRIQVKGRLASRGQESIDGFAVEAQSDDETTIVGTVADQSALYGVLLRLHTLGLLLLLVERVQSDVAHAPPVPHDQRRTR
jgi:hypothetical protein